MAARGCITTSVLGMPCSGDLNCSCRQATAAGLSSEELRDRLVHMCKQAMVGIGAMINHCEGILRSTE